MSCAEEAGITLDPMALGDPIEASLADFTWAGVRFVQDQTFFAVAMPADVVVSFAGQEALELATTDKHGWLLPADLEDGTERPADPDLPRLMRLAVATVLGA